MGYRGVTEYTPLWNNSNLQETFLIGKAKAWEIQGIKRLRQLYVGNTLKKFSDLRRKFNIPQCTFYTYLQVGHALEAQFREKPLNGIKCPCFKVYFR